MLKKLFETYEKEMLKAATKAEWPNPKDPWQGFRLLAAMAGIAVALWIGRGLEYVVGLL